MSFTEWSNAKKKKEESSKSTSATNNTASGKTGSGGTGMSFAEWSNKKKTGSAITGYNSKDAEYGWNNFLADQKKKREEEEEKSFIEKALGWLAQSADTTLPGANITTVTNAYRNDTSYMEPTDKWSDQDRNDFGYLYSQDPGKAYAFAEELNDRINREEKEAQRAAVTTKAVSNPVAHTIGAIATAPLGAVDYINDLAENTARGKITEKDGNLTPFEYSQTVTGGISQNLNDKYGTLDEDIPIFGGKGWGDVYGLGVSAAQSYVGGKLSKVLGLGQAGVLASFFGSSAASGIDEARARGASDDQAILFGTISGAAEVLTELVPLDNLMNIGPAANWKGLFVDVIKQGGEEFLGEGANSIITNVADYLTFGDKSEYAMLKSQYMESGLSEKDASKKAFKKIVEGVAFDAIGGFATGSTSAGVASGVATSLDALTTQVRNNKIGNTIMSAEGGVEALKQLANDVAGVASEDIQNSIAKQTSKVDKKGTAANVGKLYSAVQNANNLVNASANQADIVKSLVRKGFTAETATDIANALVASYNGEQLSAAQSKILESAMNNSAVQDAISNIMNNAKSTMGQRSQNIRDFQSDIAVRRVAKASGISVDEARNLAKGNLTTAEENAPESHYEVSVDGKTIDRDGNIITIKGISSIEKGHMALETEEGNTIDASEVSYGSQTEALVYEAVSNLEGIIDTNTANKLSKHLLKLGDSSSDGYAKGIEQAYTYGYYGYGRNAMTAENTLSSTLTEKQRNVAYGLGEQYRNARTIAQQALAKSATVSKMEAVGKVHFEGDRSRLTERQNASLSALETVADAMGVQIHVFESQVDESGKRIGANGWYDPKDNSIHIDLHAGAKGEGTMLFTAAHELTHHIRKWSPEKFKTLSDFLMQEYGKKGVNVDGLVREQMAKAQRGGRSISYDTAYEEVVADSMESMLADGSIVEKLAKLKQTDKSLWQKVKDYISELAAKIRKVYEGLAPDSVEGRYVAEMKDSIEKLQELFTEGLVDASENYQSSLTPGEEGTVVNENGDPVAYSTEDGSVLLSMRTYEEEGRDAFRKYLEKCVKNKSLTKAEMQEMLDGIEDIYQTCKEFKDKYAPFSSWSDAAVVRDTRGKPVFSVVTPNGDYKMNLDFSLVCKKRRTLDAVFNEMTKRGIIDDFELGQKSVVKINEIIRKYGLETACALCFVDAKRFRQASMADQFTSLYNELVESLVPEDQKGSIDHFNFSGYETIKKVEGGIDTWANSKLDFSHINHVLKTYGDGTVEYKAAKYIKNNPKGRKLLMRGDFMSSKGFDAVKTQNQDILKLYNSKKGTGGPKAAFGDVQYMNEVIQKARWWTPEKAYAVGGVRIQSFSDYVPRMVFDYTQMIYDLAATKLPAHAYTKEALFVKQFGLTGVKINMSLIPAIAEGGIAPGLDADGNYVWAGESFDFETAKEIQNAEGYSENCGTICVGVSYEHIRKLLSDPDIRMVIPYHKSGLNPIVAHMNKIAEFTDYTTLQTNPGGCQNTMDKNGNKVAVDFNFNEVLRKTGDPKATVRQYLDWCAKNEYTPRFAEFAWHENYYKLIEDFTLYDKNGKYVPQHEVRAVFPKADSAFGSMKDLIQEGLQEDAIVEGKREKNLSKIVDEIQETLPKTEAEIEETQVAQADRDLEAAEASGDGNKFSMRDIDIERVFIEYGDNAAEKASIDSTVASLVSRGKTVNINPKNVKKHGTNGKWADWKVAREYLKGILEKFIGNSVYFTHNNQYAEAYLTRAGVDHSVGGTITAERAEIFDQFKKLIKNAEYAFSSKNDPHSNSNKKISGRIDWDCFVAVAMIGDESYPVVFKIRTIDRDVRSQIHEMSMKKEADGSHDPGKQNELQGGMSTYRVVPSTSDDKVTQEEAEVKKFSDRDNAPTFYSHMARVVDGVKQEKLGAASVVSMLRGKGVKVEEIKWSGIETWLEGKKSVTKAELQEFIQGNMLQIAEEQSSTASVALRYKGNDTYKLYDAEGNVLDTFIFNEFMNGYISEKTDEIYSYTYEIEDAVREEYGNQSLPRWADYKLDGGSNYREIVFKLPNNSYSNQAMRVHWGDDAEGVLAHARIQDFDVNGKKMLFVEELQSDYHNEGHEAGYADSKTEKKIDELKAKAEEKFFALEDYSTEVTGYAGEWEEVEKTVKGARLLLEYNEAQNAYDQAMNEFVKKIPDAPFKDTYHEYVMKRLLRMAAEEGYDSIGWTPSEIQVKRWSEEFEEGYRIEYDQDMPKFMNKYGKKWGTRVGKTVLDSGTEVWSMAITDEMKNSVLTDGQPLYSERDTESVSNRSLLANAFEGVAQNDIERNKIQEYKNKISLIESEERILTDLNAQIKELSFAKGKRDTKKINELRFEAQQAANRISTYDKQLLRLEASKPLKAVLEREKKMAYQRAEQKGKEALAEYKQKAEAKQKETTERYREARKKAVAKARETAEKRMKKKHEESLQNDRERREKTAMRHKIQNVVKELNDLLLSNDKKRHVPDSMKKAVTEALELVNMDTVGSEERAAYYANLIAKEQAKEEPDQAKIDAYTVTMENILRQGEKIGQRLKDLRDAYEEIQNSDDPDIANAYDPVIAGSLKELAGSIGNTSLRNMTIEQLSDVYDMYRMVLTRVRDANKSFLNEKKESISNLASRVVGEVRMTGGEHKYRAAVLDFFRKFEWNNLKPVYAFEHIGSATLTEAFNSVRAGEDTWAKDVTEAREYYLDKAKKYGYDSWDFKKKYTFENDADQKFELTLEQILSLYAYSKREQAHDHLRLGGFVFDSNIETYKDKGSKLIKYKVNTADAHQITPEILANIIGKLTAEQTGFVDEMQDYLSTVMGAKGNEVTMKMYGVKLFKEKFYFPLKSAKQFMFEQNEVSGEVKIKNSGFTNKTVAKANNPVILSNFMDVWAGHVNEMSMYHSFVLPLEDFNRIFNYNSPKQENQPPVSVKGTIQNAYSPAAVSYVKELITDLNGGARTDSTTGIINKFMGMFKKGAVFASASVVVQQPSAIARASALVDLKYFIGPKVDHKRHKALWDEVKQYAPVAVIKEMGYFDTNMGKSTQDFIKGKEYYGIMEKAKAIFTDSDFRDEALSKAPALADELAWCSIWEAVKRETKAKNNGLDVKSEAFLQKAGERFTEVITKTQVYDSALSRSANMRSKDTGMKMATAFMAEPTTSINMIADALMKGKRGDKKSCRKAIGSVVASVLLNSFLVAWVYAARDDDEEETFAEKYIASFVSGVADGINPATYIPFMKDIVSIVQGYDVERSDMSVISDIVTAYQKLGREDVSAWRKVEDFAGSICKLFGLPVKNIMRDLRAVWQTYDTLVNGETTTKAGIKYAIQGELTGKTTSNKEQLYEAKLAKDKEHAARVVGRYEDVDSANAAVRAVIKDRFMAGEIDAKTARKYLVLHAGMDAIDVVWLMDSWEYNLENGSSEGYSKYNNFYEAVQTGKNLKSVIKEYTDSGIEAHTLKSQLTEHFKPKYMEMSTSEKANIKGYLLNALTELGATRKEAEEKIGDWEFESKYGFSYSNRVSAFKEGKVSESVLRKVMVEYGGMSETDADNNIRAYKWMKSNPGYDLSVSEVLAYTEPISKIGISVEDSGIRPDVFVQYRELKGKCEGTDNNGDGKTDYNSVKNQVMDVINNLPITSEQKDVLYYQNGWSAGNIWKAPWR